MGRTLKRVPMDFDWPIDQIWLGFLNEHYGRGQDCVVCEGSGYSPEYCKLNDKWYSFEESNYLPNPYREGFRYNANAWNNNLTTEDVKALLDAGRLHDFTKQGITPTAEQVNEWNLKGMGHDSINAHVCIEARLNGKSSTCQKCDGEGRIWPSDEAKKAYHDWHPTEPPKGEGFQMWNTTTEGHPQTPVFETLSELSEYCAEHCTTFASNKTDAESWASMLGDGMVHHKEGNMTFI